nr:reverse transcriptase domain-containing protein [Tanacetum cinerariifolium]
MIFHGKVFCIHAKEVPGWTPNLLDDSDNEEDGSIEGDNNGQDLGSNGDNSDLEAVPNDNTNVVNSGPAFPPEFTPPVDQVGVGSKGDNLNNDNLNVKTAGSDDVRTFGGSKVHSACSGSFKKSIASGGSFLNVMEEVVKVGQTMEFNMEGCEANMSEIIKSQGASMFIDEFFISKHLRPRPKGQKRLGLGAGNYAFEFSHSNSVGNSGGILCVWDLGSFQKNSHTISDSFVILQGVWLDDPPKDPPKIPMMDNRTMAKMLCAPTEGYAEAIVVPPILAKKFELKHSLINMMTSEQFFGLEKDNPHDHIRCPQVLEKEPPRSITTWEDLISKFINEFFPPSRTTSLRNEISNFEQKFGESFHETWERYKDLLRACPHHGFTKLHQLNTFYNALNLTDQDSLNAAAGGNLLERSTQDVLTIIENKSKVCNFRNKSIASQVKACDTNSSSEIAKLTHAVNEQTSAMTTAMTAMLRQFQATPPSAPVKAVEEKCVTCGGAHLYYQCLAADGNTFPELRDNIQRYVSAAAV